MLEILKNMKNTTWALNFDSDWIQNMRKWYNYKNFQNSADKKALKNKIVTFANYNWLIIITC